MTDEIDSTPARKLSAKTIWGKIKRSDTPEKGIKPLFTIIGQAYGVRKGTSEYGEWVALVGNFEAVNSDTGEVFSGPECFLPEPFNSMVANQLQGEGKSNAVDFAFDVGIKAAAEDAAVPYEYTCKPLQEPGAADPLKALRARLPQRALPKPSAAKGK